jgi:hypothetical protein
MVLLDMANAPSRQLSPNTFATWVATGPSFFFYRNDPTPGDPNAVIRTLAYRLASFDTLINWLFVL